MRHDLLRTLVFSDSKSVSISASYDGKTTRLKERRAE
jgi:hypothetical protein